MASPHWKRHNNKIYYIGAGVAAAFFTLVSVGEQIPRWAALLLSVVIGLIGVGMMVWSKGPMSDTMTLRLKLDHKRVDEAVKEMIKLKRLSASRDLDADIQTPFFEFQGHGLILDVLPYDLLNGKVIGLSIYANRYASETTGTLLQFRGINTKNRALAEKLAEILDEVVDDLKLPSPVDEQGS